MRNPFKKLASAGVAETLKEGTKLIDEIFTTKEEKMQGKLELFKMTIGDRDSARRMYEQDSWLQKTFAIFFLVVWCGLTILILSYFVFKAIELKDWQIGFISTINGGISTKLNTIVDFLFGGSMTGNKNNSLNFKNKQNDESNI